jgi:hypothetical protein
MYSRSNYNALLNSLGTQSAVTTGLSLSHTQSFNEFADLIRRNRKKRLEQKPIQEEEVEEEKDLDSGGN